MSLPQELVLYCSPHPLWQGRAEGVFAALGLSARRLTPQDGGRTVGDLAGLPGHPAPPVCLAPPPLREGLLVLCGLSRARMDVLFDALRAAGAPPPDRKAVLTPTNAAWTLAALSDELGREHAATHSANFSGRAE